MKVVKVAAGLICHEGRYLIARRNPGVHLAGFWEFPGGKCESGETLEACLRRELFEELGIRIDVPIPFQAVRHEYAEKIVELHFFHCRIEVGHAEAFLLRAVKISQLLKPESLRCLDHQRIDGRLAGIGNNAQRPGSTVKLGLAAPVCFRAPEVGQDIGV